jgi:drug/metabolite transporter (DMT)-like permease
MFGHTLALPEGNDIFWLLALAWACTLFPFALALVALRKLSAFSAQLAVNLEPVYTIALATLFLGEADDLRWPFYLGVVVILGAVIVHARRPAEKTSVQIAAQASVPTSVTQHPGK